MTAADFRPVLSACTHLVAADALGRADLLPLILAVEDEALALAEHFHPDLRDLAHESVQQRRQAA